jgi:hypothetical protein
MLRTINRMDKLAAIQSVFRDRRLLAGSIVEHMALQATENLPPVLSWNETAANEDGGSGYDDDDIMMDVGPAPGPQTEMMIRLASRHHKI